MAIETHPACPKCGGASHSEAPAAPTSSDLDTVMLAGLLGRLAVDSARTLRVRCAACGLEYWRTPGGFKRAWLRLCYGTRFKFHAA